LDEGDILLVRGRWSDILKLTEDKMLKVNNQLQYGKKVPEDAKWMMTEVMIGPTSSAAGRRLVLFNRTWTYNTLILGIQRRGSIIRNKLD
ncbi:hypothetical protein QP445_15280, partial [Micrococcus luteus]|nr:hypothetical protein [Micrococcus luteus]